ncbi:hypothetical protein VP01_170g8 [Puccinia sorghi]|uniref:Uncharacterized protein n=1 Tax=Puccinia sorghi TaxID=27349 RepID=A0A0L6VFJ9_9BASI|nr:hypothetical protein VP01_170g8 [Puccinia sorghi]
MQPHDRPSPNCGTQTTGSAEEYLRASRGTPVLWSAHPVCHLAKKDTLDCSTLFSQHSWLEQCGGIEQAKGTQHDRAALFQPEEPQDSELAPLAYYNYVKRAFSATSYHHSNSDSTDVLQIQSPSSTSINLFTNSNEAIQTSKLAEETLISPHATFRPSLKEPRPTEDQPSRREQQPVKPAQTMSLLTSMLTYPILEPLKIHAANRAIKVLEEKFLFRSLQARMRLLRNDSSNCFTSREAWDAQGLATQAETFFALTFGAIKFDALPMLWNHLEAIQDQAMCVGDGLLNMGKHLSKLHTWECESLTPAGVRYDAMMEESSGSRADPQGSDGAEVAETRLTGLLLDIAQDITSAQDLVTFYHSCILSFQLTLAEFLGTIPAGVLPFDELVIWVRLCVLSIVDIAHGLASFPIISDKISQEISADWPSSV